jgi:hypothetical protein
MNYLQKFEIDYLKIDQSFIRDITSNAAHRTIAETMILMAHKLGLKAIAEGVETQEQLDILKEAGCDYGQGFLFSPPLPPEQFEKMLPRGKARWGGELRTLATIWLFAGPDRDNLVNFSDQLARIRALGYELACQFVASGSRGLDGNKILAQRHHGTIGWPILSVKHLDFHSPTLLTGITAINKAYVKQMTIILRNLQTRH